MPAAPGTPDPMHLLRDRRAFTLIELLSALAITGILAAILVPTVRNGLEKAKEAGCVSNLRNIAAASQHYIAEHDGNIVPSSYTDKRLPSGNQDTFWNSALLEFFNETTNDAKRRADFSCTEWRKVGANYTNWNWGYGINDTPLYDQNDAKPITQNIRITIDADGAQTGNPVKFVRITNPSKRLQFCCSDMWQINQNNLENDGFVAFDRHGKNRCNVAFFDGHIESMRRENIAKAVRNPN